jgi:hypothetical protein
MNLDLARGDTGRNFSLNLDVQVLIFKLSATHLVLTSSPYRELFGTYAWLYPTNENSLSDGRQIKKRKQLKTNFPRWPVSHVLLVASIEPIFEFRHHTITSISTWIGNAIIPSMSKQFAMTKVNEWAFDCKNCHCYFKKWITTKCTRLDTSSECTKSTKIYSIDGMNSRYSWLYIIGRFAFDFVSIFKYFFLRH